MERRSAVTARRRCLSSHRNICALIALAVLLCLTARPCANAQDLRLQPTETTSTSTAAGSGQPEESAPHRADNTAAPNSTGELPIPPQSDVSESPATRYGSAAVSSSSSSGTAKTPPQSVDLREALERRGTLNLHDVELRAALFMISDQWGINVVCGEVKGTVNGVFRNAPLREILDSILLSNGYNYRAVGESLVVSSVAELGQINPFFQSATIHVQSADIDEVVSGARLLTTPQGQILAIKSARSIIVLDFPDRVAMIRDFVRSIDGATSMSAGGAARAGQPLEVGYFRTQYIPAKAAEDALQAVLSKDGRVAVLEKEDRLLVSDYAENLDIIQTVLQRIDRPRPQVRITALIYDISLEDLEQLGIRWNQFGYLSGDNSGAAVGFGTQPVQTDVSDGGIAATLTDGANLAFGALSQHFDIRGVAMALQGAKDTRLLADPSVAVLENEEAIFKSVQEIPIQQLTQTGQGGQIGTTAFREAGIKLTVTPKIAADGMIRMHVSPEFSRQNGTDLQGQPIIDTRFAETVLTAANRQTIVIAGLRQREDIGEFSGIPYLKDIHGVGKLFRARDTRVRESELVVFLCAEIIGPADPLNHREALVVDTIGCRLNQIPTAEGCPLPPCSMSCDGGFAGPVRLPQPEIVGDPALPGNVAPAMPTEMAAAAPTSKSAVSGGNHTANRPTTLQNEARPPLWQAPPLDQAQIPTAPPTPSTPLFAAPRPLVGPPQPDMNARPGPLPYQDSARISGRPLQRTLRR
jgi:type II secretory pathway component GspD/PulD (secretin)